MNSAEKEEGPISAAPRKEIPQIKPSETHRRTVRGLMRRARAATLATLLDGAPYASLATVATDIDASPLLLLSGLSDHTRNLDADPRISLLFEETQGLDNPQTGPRASIQGRAVRLPEGPERDRAARRFLARHPAAALYAGFGDFAFWRVEVERAHFVGGFARAVWIDDGIVLPPETAEAYAALEPGVVAHMNEDHAEAVALYARVLAGLNGEGWRLSAIDPDGLDLTLDGQRGERLPFDPPLGGPDEVRARLVALATQARKQAS